MWVCREVRKIWRAYNEFMVDMGQYNSVVKMYDDVFKIGTVGEVSKVKIKIIKGMIQIERPVNGSIKNIMP
jgi:ribosomal protein S28E/S33